MSERMGALKTVGRGWEAPEALPSAVAIETVGREAIVVGVVGEDEDRSFPVGFGPWSFFAQNCGGRGKALSPLAPQLA